jgi:hypothetical protein
MRSSLLLLSLCAACSSVDPLIGTFNFTLTGSDTQTAPTSGTNPASGNGSVAITHGVAVDSYDITVAQVNSTACTVKGMQNDKDPLTIDITTMQTCSFASGTGSVTATFTSGSATVKEDTLTLQVGYSYAGTSFGINFAGTGSRTYTGPRF